VNFKFEEVAAGDTSISKTTGFTQHSGNINQQNPI